MDMKVKIVANFAVDSLKTFTLNFTLSLKIKKKFRDELFSCISSTRGIIQMQDFFKGFSP